MEENLEKSVNAVEDNRSARIFHQIIAFFPRCFEKSLFDRELGLNWMERVEEE